MAALAMYKSGKNAVESNETRDTLLLVGGLSLMIFGAGLVVTNPAVRKLLGGANVGGLFQAAIPDLERYMKMRAM